MVIYVSQMLELFGYSNQDLYLYINQCMNTDKCSPIQQILRYKYSSKVYSDSRLYYNCYDAK